jgi:histidine phosphotransferase ChpT
MDHARLIETLEIFSARICHDLVGPVGAISNGVELLSEGGMSGDPEVIALIADSARGASRRLQFFRSAFGAGNTVSGGQPLEGARALAMDYFADGKVRLAWPIPGSALETRADRRTVRLLLNLLLVAADCLPRGGSVAVDALPSADGGLVVTIRAEGTQARIIDEQRAILTVATSTADAPPPSPRAVPAWLASIVRTLAAASLAIEDADGTVAFVLRFPARA